eukprot:266313_1
MVTKHEKFILYKSTELFIRQCDDIYQILQLQPEQDGIESDINLELFRRINNKRSFGWEEQQERIHLCTFFTNVLLIHLVLVFIVVSMYIKYGCVNYIALFEFVVLLFIFGFAVNEFFVQLYN